MTHTHHLEGVYNSTKKNGELYFRSSITFKRKHISLGSFPTELLAHTAYKIALNIINDSSITLITYDKASILTFEKWVILINFRDNHLYIGKPIYIRPKFFYYYLSPDHILKFDIDDLFYYSSHKIMCRGSHYFVSDYGMQISIASRYGIKNYAVCNVDFSFINGDNTDFRRENINIINIYHGVRKIIRKGTEMYSARIHINGYYKIGEYHTMIDAAIAYNKAIDILKSQGIYKNYQSNYIETITPRQYADIYSSLSISPKIINYFSE